MQWIQFQASIFRLLTSTRRRRWWWGAAGWERRPHSQRWESRRGAVPCPWSIREETGAKKPFRPDYTHAHIHTCRGGKQHRGAHTCVHQQSLWVCAAIWKNRQLPVGKQLNGTIRPWRRQGDLKVNMSERWRGKLNKRSGALCFSVEPWTHQMKREGYGGSIIHFPGEVKGATAFSH